MTARAFATPEEPGRNWDDLQFRFIFALSFVFYFATAIARRFTPHYWRSGTAHGSILADAVTGAGTIARIAFYG